MIGTHRRISELMLALVCILVAGRGLPSSHVDASSTHRDVKGTLKISDWQFPDTLNPVQAKSDVSRHLSALLWDPLIGFDDRARPFGDLAMEVPSLENGLAKVVNNELVVTMHLRDGLQWSDGQPITSADVRFGWEVYSNAETGPMCKSTCSAISAIETPDGRTAVLHFQSGFGDFLNRLPPVLPAHSFASVQAAAHTLGTDTAFNYESRIYVTSGPFQVSEFVFDDHIVFTPNPHYSALPGPYLASVVFAFYSSKPGMIAAAASVQTDATENYTLFDLPELRKHIDAYTLHIAPGTAMEYLYFNTAPTVNGKPNPLSDVKVRQALNLVLDPHEMCMAAFSDEATCTLLVDTSPIGHASTVQAAVHVPARDLQVAKSLLAASSFGGQSLSLDLYTTQGNPVRKAEVDVIVRSLEQLGIRVSSNFVPSSVLTADWDHQGIFAHGMFNLGLGTLPAGMYPDTLVSSFGSQYSPSAANTSDMNRNFMRVSDTEVDTALADASRSVDRTARQSLFSKFAQRVVDQAYGLALYDIPTISTSDDKFGHFFPNALGPYWNSFEWYDRGTDVTPPPAIRDGPTPTATPKPTATATVTPTPLPSVGIDKVIILHAVKGRNVATKQVYLGEHPTFVLEYHDANAGPYVPAGSVAITWKGHEIGKFQMEQATYDGRSAFTARIRFLDGSRTGTLVAHFRLSLGPTSAKRDRKFTVISKHRTSE